MDAPPNRLFSAGLIGLSPLEMALLANSIGFCQPGGELGVNIIHACDAKVMHMVAGRNSVYPAKTGMVKSTRQDDMAVQPARFRRDLRERHAHLKGNSRLLWENAHRT